MALNKVLLSKALYDAEAKDVDMTNEASAKVKARCDAVASAIYDFVTSADILIDVLPGIPVATAGTPAAQTGTTTGNGQGKSKSIS
jgi:orotate phosphoribosyltransferase-like protein